MKISVMNQKGGVGKTTMVHNLMVGLSRRGFSCLGIDLDPQANLTIGFGIEPENNKNILSLISNNMTIESVLISKNGINLIPASLELSEFDLFLSTELMRESKIKKYINSLSKKYDFIFLDCGPTLGLLTINALVAADSVLVPMQTEFYSIVGLESLFKTIKKVKDNGLNNKLDLLGIVLTLFDGRTNLHKEVEKEVVNIHQKIVFKSKIRLNTALASAPSHFKSIFDFAPTSNGAKDFLAFINEFLEKTGKKEIINV